MTSQSSELEPTFDQRLENLSDADRATFENCAREIEIRAGQGVLEPFSLASDLPEVNNLRALVLVHCGKIWMECTREQVEQYLAVFPELRDHRWAIEELAAWKEQLACGSGDPPGRLNGSEAEHVEMEVREFVFPDFLKPVRSFGKSGMAEVWLVQNQRTHREEVLKTANQAVLLDPELLKRFRSEPGKASQFKLDSIVTVYGCEESCGVPYFLMEHMNAGSLADKLSSGPIVAYQAVKYIAQMARTVGRVHERGLVHYDIKPANILFTRTDDGREVIKLADFGLARTLPAQWKEGLSASVEVTRLVDQVPTRVVGTAGFIPPEAFDDGLWNGARPSELEKGVQADVFALGVTLYHALTGRLPFQQPGEVGKPALINPLAPMVHELVPPRVIHPSLDVELDAICQRALRKSPTNRFRDAYDLATALEHWLGQAALRGASNEQNARSGTAAAPEVQSPSASEKSKPRAETVDPYAPTTLNPADQWRRAPAWALPVTAIAVVCLAVAVFVDPGEAFRGDNGKRLHDSEEEERRDQKTVERNGALSPTEKTADLDPFSKSLVQNQWPRESAVAVSRLNQAWFDCLKDTDTLERQQVNLRRLGKSQLPMLTMRSEPQLASLLASVSDAQLQQDVLRFLTVDAATDDRPAVMNAYLRAPGRQKAESLTQFYQDYLALGIEMQHKGLVGAETLLLGSDSVHASTALSEWLTDILSMGDGSDLSDFLPYFALFVCQGRDISARMSAEPEFRQQFLNDLWPRFKNLTRRSAKGEAAGPSVEILMAEPAIWKALADPDGTELVAELGLAPVVLLYGDHPYPQELKPRVKVLLKSRNRIIIESLLAENLRDNSDFLRLIGMQIEVRLLATALHQVRQAGTSEQMAVALNQLAAKSEADLVEELSPLAETPGLLDGVPQGIYLQVGLKALTGQRVGRREWEQVARRAVLDVANAIATYCGAPPGMMEGFEAGYWGAINAVDRSKDARLKEAERQANRPLTAQEREQILRDAESEVVHSQNFIRAMELVRNHVLQNSDQKIVDLTPSVLFFSTLTPDEFRSRETVDWKQVAVFGLPDGRALIGFRENCKFAKQHPRIVKFFDERLTLVRNHFDAAAGTQTPASAKAAEKAWRESVSAWWLLSVGGDMPMANWRGETAGPTDEPSTSKAF
jgi:serine/threonine-protein kinase